ncbi:MAG: acyl--CoA ligase [Deltaproteobacteria bacterium]|nr:acyl--CoA ligase [Deltaproteobacteria bacterium]
MAWQRLELIWHYLEKWAAERPTAEAVVFENTRLTWGQLKEKVDQTAQAFLELGVRQGDRVATLAMARPEFLITYLAAGKVGAMWLGLSPKFTAPELDFLLGDSRPRVLVAVGEFQDQDLTPLLRNLLTRHDFLQKILVLGEPAEGLPSFEEFIAAARPRGAADLERRAALVSPTDEVLLMYTSGSTGKPKGVVHTHASILANIAVELEKFLFDGEMRMLLHFPINHVAADVEVTVAGLMAGGCLVMMDKFDPADSLEVIAREKVTALGQIPAMFLLQFRDPSFSPAKLASVRQFIWAGAAAPRLMIEVLSQVCQATGAQMLTGYGSTEVGGFVTYTAVGDGLDRLASSAGQIAPPFELQIVDEDHQPLPVGEVGEIAVRGPFLMKGYYQNPQATAQVVDPEGWYYTSDLAKQDEAGYIYIAGRSSEMFKSGGENVYPREVEDVIEHHPGVLMSAVISQPHEVYGEVGWAFVMPRPGQEVKEEELAQICRSHLANFKIPKRFVVRPLLPLLPNGKVDKLALRREAANL